MFSGDRIIKEALDIDPNKRPDSLKIMFFMNPSLYINSVKQSSAKENSHPNKTNRKRKYNSKTKSKSKSKSTSKSR